MGKQWPLTKKKKINKNIQNKLDVEKSVKLDIYSSLHSKYRREMNIFHHKLQETYKN
jgi:hypothetical protein